MISFPQQLAQLRVEHETLIARPNVLDPTWHNGLFDRYRYPVVTAAHIPIDWRYDLNPQSNPYLSERLGVNAVFNAGAIEIANRILIVCRVEGADRKSFFAVAESPNGIDHFRFWDEPIELPVDGVLDLHTFNPREIKDLVPDYLAACRAKGIYQVRILEFRDAREVRNEFHFFISAAGRVHGYRGNCQGEADHELLVERLVLVRKVHAPALPFILNTVVGFDKIPLIERVTASVIENERFDKGEHQLAIQVLHLIPRKLVTESGEISPAIVEVESEACRRDAGHVRVIADIGVGGKKLGERIAGLKPYVGKLAAFVRKSQQVAPVAAQLVPLAEPEIENVAVNGRPGGIGVLFAEYSNNTGGSSLVRCVTAELSS